MSMLTNTNGPFVDEIKTSNLVEIAQVLGTSYRHLNRVINELVEIGVLVMIGGVLIFQFK